jgi:pimeloyl-ACP methyl ester carboxylesterase
VISKTQTAASARSVVSATSCPPSVEIPTRHAASGSRTRKTKKEEIHASKAEASHFPAAPLRRTLWPHNCTTGNAYDEGLLKFWDPIKKYWNEDKPENRAAIHFLVEPKSTRWQYQNGVSDLTLLDPTTWSLDQIGLDRAGNPDIQMDLMYDYRTNVPLYPEFQNFFRKNQPPTLIVWVKNDFIFPAEGAAPYSRDLKNLETHLPDTGHFALETHSEEIASRIETFLSKNKITR